MKQAERVLKYMRDFGSITQHPARHGNEQEPVWRGYELCQIQVGGMMEDRQQAPFITDINGAEIYDGNEYFVSGEGNIAAASPGENWNVHNALIEHLVETYGTNYIAEMCGLDKRVCKI